MKLEKREIKFRAWIKYSCQGGHMIEWNGIENTSANRLHEVFDGMLGGGVILMQYTGITDKNGVEAYEGDIIIMNDTLKNKKWVALIFYNSKLARFDCKNTRGKIKHLHVVSHPQWKFEVIGNIYENPELLDDTHA